jgi:hypothetical protein
MLPVDTNGQERPVIDCGCSPHGVIHGWWPILRGRLGILIRLDRAAALEPDRCQKGSAEHTEPCVRVPARRAAPQPPPKRVLGGASSTGQPLGRAAFGNPQSGSVRTAAHGTIVPAGIMRASEARKCGGVGIDDPANLCPTWGIGNRLSFGFAPRGRHILVVCRAHPVTGLERRSEWRIGHLVCKRRA